MLVRYRPGRHLPRHQEDGIFYHPVRNRLLFGVTPARPGVQPSITAIWQGGPDGQMVNVYPVQFGPEQRQEPLPYADLYTRSLLSMGSAGKALIWGDAQRHEIIVATLFPGCDAAE